MSKTNGNGNQKFKWVGTRPIRPDGVDKVMGRANYGADHALPGMLWGQVLRSPHAHARIRGIDTSKALALEGVKAVITASDLPEITSGESKVGEGPTGIQYDGGRGALYVLNKFDASISPGSVAITLVIIMLITVTFYMRMMTGKSTSRDESLM